MVTGKLVIGRHRAEEEKIGVVVSTFRRPYLVVIVTIEEYSHSTLLLVAHAFNMHLTACDFARAWLKAGSGIEA